MSATSGGAEGLGSRMGNRVTVGKWKGHQFYKWRASFIEGGQRRKKGFKTKKAAEKWAKDKEEEALADGTGSKLTFPERAAVINSREALAVCGLSLQAAIDFAVARHQATSDSIAVSEAVARLLQVKEDAGKKQRYLKDIKSRLGIFANDFGTRKITGVSNLEIEEWLKGRDLSPVSNNKYRQLLAMMYDRAIMDGHLDEGLNPAKKVERQAVPEKKVDVLHAAEMRKLLNAASDKILPFFVLGAFAGLRTSEIERLDWSDINFTESHIEIRGAKTRAGERYVTMNPTLKVWLKRLEKNTGRVYPGNGRVLFEATRHKVGYGTPSELTDEAKSKGVQLRPWPKNVLRDSFASFHLALHKDAPALALEMGHENTRTIYSNYRKAVTVGEAKKYWALRPKRQKEN